MPPPSANGKWSALLLLLLLSLSHSTVFPYFAPVVVTFPSLCVTYFPTSLPVTCFLFPPSSSPFLHVEGEREMKEGRKWKVKNRKGRLDFFVLIFFVNYRIRLFQWNSLVSIDIWISSLSAFFSLYIAEITDIIVIYNLWAWPYFLFRILNVLLSVERVVWSVEREGHVHLTFSTHFVPSIIPL